ncbi:MAG: aspartate/glutamate racemase family protein [Asticcacaulis sp.]|uniref:aspartate/glutamate racemase family protein n=1 Tax=Asticcacaulis sp. TaxID=1872648 RepID=UPI0039E2B844
MRKIGLLGGMSWESTATYYKLINEGIRQALGGLASADILMRSLDFQTIVALQKADRWDEAACLLGDAAQGLEVAGADCILICTNTMHLVAEQVAASCDVPLIHIIGETGKTIKAAGHRRPLLLATRYTMEHGFYAEHMRRHGLDVIVPEADDRLICHNAIFDELCQGVVSPRARQALIDMTRRGADMGADCVILGCTELGLSVDASCLPLPCFDSTHIHAQAAVEFALTEKPLWPARQFVMAGAYI